MSLLKIAVLCSSLFLGQVSHAENVSIIEQEYFSINYDDYKNTIIFSGDMVENTAYYIKLAFLLTNADTISLNSNGGLVFEGYKLGDFISRNGINVLIDQNNHCYSSCAFAAIGSSNIQFKGNNGLYFHSPHSRYFDPSLRLDDIEKNTEISTAIMIKYILDQGYNLQFAYTIIFETSKNFMMYIDNVEDLKKYKKDNPLDNTEEGNYKIVGMQY